MLASGLRLDTWPFQISTSAPVVLRAGATLEAVRARAIVVATGAVQRRLDLPGERSLWGRYLHSCALCDGALYVGKRVCVVGGGDAAVDAALYLARSAERVVLIHRRHDFRASNAAAVAAVRRRPNVEVLTPHAVVAWRSEDSGRGPRLLGARVRSPDGERGVDCEGAFLMIGSRPNTALLSGTGVKLDEGGYVALPGRGKETSVPGVFAAGEVADAAYRQAVTAAGDGAAAAIDAERWLRGRGDSLAGPRAGPGAAEGPRAGAGADDEHVAAAGEAAPGGTAADAAVGGLPECDLRSAECVRRTVAARPVVVFSKDYCPFCRMALETLALEGVPSPSVVDLTGPSGREIQGVLEDLTGRRTVPNVFVGGRAIGGYDEVAALHAEAKLAGLLRAAGALH